MTVTKALTAGSDLKISFRTSARDSIYVSVLYSAGKPIDGYRSCELFGDTVDRTVDFEKPLAELGGRKVKLSFTMSDAETFSITMNL